MLLSPALQQSDELDPEPAVPASPEWGSKLLCKCQMVWTRSNMELHQRGRQRRAGQQARAQESPEAVASTVAVGLTIAAAGFAGRYVLQAMKHMEPGLQSLPKSAFSGGEHRGGFEPKTTKRAALIPGVSPTANKGKIRDAHRGIMLLNHPDKGGSPNTAAKIREAKDLLEGQAKT
ncbi:mitochondrial import inner membrane translocase subunit TIM14-like [Lepus europaeus]|uniref:mitochondrial import inner membrane translocase subunit TIM14-like n=1 Tax=Lepus europaeus TaxID=9983 RepID=UPI002B4689B4|nr:mitochondrial import inner membrane translocase subunit TIM14-like [Lepus europaeus]